MTCAAEALIDLSSLKYNLQRARLIAPTSRIMAVIKANGYGHGMLRVANALKLADSFAVANLDEAVILREAGFSHPVLLLKGFTGADELEIISRNGLSIIVHQAMQVDLLEKTSCEKPVDVWLKVDTGMHRLGFAPESIPDILPRLNHCSNVSKPVRLMTHMANADDRNDSQTTQQMERFNTVTEGMDTELSMANSAALIAWPQSHADWVRPGIMLYGVSPFIDSSAEDEDLKPVMTLTAKVIAINQYKRGDKIGYGGAWTCPEGMPIAVVSIGYGDGYPRTIGPDTPVLINDKRATIVGRVSMDMISIDLRGHQGVTIGDTVTLWGKGLAVEEIARCASTIPYELLCRVTERVRFVEI